MLRRGHAGKSSKGASVGSQAAVAPKEGLGGMGTLLMSLYISFCQYHSESVNASNVHPILLAIAYFLRSCSMATFFHRFHMDGFRFYLEASQSPVTSCLEVRFHVPVILSSLTRDNDRDLGSPQSSPLFFTSSTWTVSSPT